MSRAGTRGRRRPEHAAVRLELERLRDRIPFWPWRAYGALVALVIVLGVRPGAHPFWLALAALGVAALFDVGESTVKRRSARATLAARTASSSDAARPPRGDPRYQFVLCLECGGRIAGDAPSAWPECECGPDSDLEREQATVARGAGQMVPRGATLVYGSNVAVPPFLRSCDTR